MEQIKATFFQECEELLADLEAGLLALEADEADPDTINAVFRAVHSVKGGAGAFGLDFLVSFAHVFETVLDDMRAGRMAASGDAVKLMLRAADVLADLVSAARDGTQPDEAHANAMAEELSLLGGGEGGGISTGGDDLDDFEPVAFMPMQIALDDEPAPESDAIGWTVRFKPHRALYAKANDAVSLLRELARLGPCTVELDVSALAPLETLDADDAQLAWTVHLDADCPEAEVREVFEFVDGDCDLSIERAGGEPAVAIPLAAPPVDSDAPLLNASGEPMMDIQALLARASGAIEPAPEAAPMAAPVATPEAPAVQASTKVLDGVEKTNAAPVQATIRVDLERVDRLIDLVGELVINQAMLAQRVVEAGMARSSTVAVGLDELEQLTREIQDSVMAIRAQPVKSVFQRIPRLVREVAALTGKQARLVTEGETTEVDKTVIERLSDPITHMIRNAIDHGLETPADRVAAGKPPEGTVRLSAQHRSGRIVIEVSDDGKGINRERVRDIAIKRGLLDPNTQLTDEEADNLIFLPGFSTAATISDVSGRGVGMDVVKRSIMALGGRISISSRPGEGSTFTMSLPLTLAVLDGMVVSAGNQTLVAPLTSIIETLQPKPQDVQVLGSGRVLSVRGAYVPLIDVGRALGYRPEPVDPTTGVALLVESDVGGQAALLVDGIQGQRQVVIKSLEANYQRVDGIAAATILGDGRVAFILDIEAVVASRRPHPARPDQAAAPLKAAS
jgi:two-component system chemotaxis sensor kinase CheA